MPATVRFSKARASLIEECRERAMNMAIPPHPLSLKKHHQRHRFNVHVQSPPGERNPISWTHSSKSRLLTAPGPALESTRNLRPIAAPLGHAMKRPSTVSFDTTAPRQQWIDHETRRVATAEGRRREATMRRKRAIPPLTPLRKNSKDTSQRTQIKPRNHRHNFT